VQHSGVSVGEVDAIRPRLAVGLVVAVMLSTALAYGVLAGGGDGAGDLATDAPVVHDAVAAAAFAGLEKRAHVSVDEQDIRAVDTATGRVFVAQGDGHICFYVVGDATPSSTGCTTVRSLDPGGPVVSTARIGGGEHRLTAIFPATVTRASVIAGGVASELALQHGITSTIVAADADALLTWTTDDGVGRSRSLRILR
jgi:hypothetical protein